MSFLHWILLVVLLTKKYWDLRTPLLGQGHSTVAPCSSRTCMELSYFSRSQIVHQTAYHVHNQCCREHQMIHTAPWAVTRIPLTSVPVSLLTACQSLWPHFLYWHCANCATQTAVLRWYLTARPGHKQIKMTAVHLVNMYTAKPVLQRLVAKYFVCVCVCFWNRERELDRGQ